MSQDPKTIAIDTSEVLERQRDPSGGEDIPKTVAIDSEDLARKVEAARQEGASSPVQSEGGMRWGLVAAVVVVVLVLAYLFAG